MTWRKKKISCELLHSAICALELKHFNVRTERLLGSSSTWPLLHEGGEGVAQLWGIESERKIRFWRQHVLFMSRSLSCEFFDFFFSLHDCWWCCCCSINIPATTMPTKTAEKSRVAKQSQNVSVRAMPQSTGDLSTPTIHESFRQSKWCNFYECFLALRHCCCSCSSLALFSLSLCCTI